MNLDEITERLERARNLLRIEEIAAKHGAMIEVKAAPLTPVDTGFLRRANSYSVMRGPAGVTLTIQNRMVYAHYQHENVLNHKQPQARDHFLSLPFEAELPKIAKDVRQFIREAFTE